MGKERLRNISSTVMYSEFCNTTKVYYLSLRFNESCHLI